MQQFEAAWPGENGKGKRKIPAEHFFAAGFGLWVGKEAKKKLQCITLGIFLEL